METYEMFTLQTELHYISSYKLHFLQSMTQKTLKIPKKHPFYSNIVDDGRYILNKSEAFLLFLMLLISI